MMVEEAKDSEEEAVDPVPVNTRGGYITKSPFRSKSNAATSHNSSKPFIVESNAFQGSAGPEGLLKAKEGHEPLLILKNEKKSDQTTHIHQDVVKLSSGDPAVSRHDAFCQLPEICVKTSKRKSPCVQDAVDDRNLGIPGNDDSSGHRPDPQPGISEYGKLVDDMRLTSESVEGHVQSDAKGSTAKYLSLIHI